MGTGVSFYLEDSSPVLQSVFFVFLREHLALEESYQQTSTFLKSNSEMKNHKNLQQEMKKQTMTDEQSLTVKYENMIG